MNAHENTHTEPPRECPNLLKALVYFNFVLLFFVGIMFFGDLKNVEDLDEVGLLGLLYAFLFLFILAFAIRSRELGGRLRSVSHLLLILVGPLGGAAAGGYTCDLITGKADWGVLLGLWGSYLGLAVYFVSRPKNRGCRLQLLTHTLLIYAGPFAVGLIGGGIGWYGFRTDEAGAMGAVIPGLAYAFPVNLIAALTQFGWKERKGTFHRVAVRLSWCGVGLVGLALICVLGYYLVGGWTGARAWAKHKAAGEANGWKYSMEDYIGGIPADDDNFFMAKPFNALLFTQELGGKTVYKNPKAEEELDALLDRSPRSVDGGLRRVSNDMVFPDWPGFAQRLSTKYSRGNKTGEYKFFADEPPSGLSDEELIRHYFTQFDGLLSDLREAAKRPGHYFPIAYENGSDTGLPHLAKFKGVAQLLRYSALAKLDRGDVDGAMGDIRLQFRVFRASDAGLFVISQLVHIAIGHITVDTINKCLHTGKLSDAHLQELDRLLTLDKEYLGQMERAMQVERISTGPGTIEAFINGAEFVMLNRRDNPGMLIPKGWHYQDLILFDSTLKEYVSLIREAKNSGRIQQSSVEALFMKAKVEATRNWHVFSGMLLRGLEKSLAKVGGLMNRFATARLGVAIERHRLAKGSLPDDLDELVSTYIDAIPVDISTGNPVAWERKGSHRFRIPSTDNRSFTWKYDPILAAIQLGDFDRLKKISDEGWVLTTPKSGEESRHEAALKVGRNRDPDPNYLGVPESVALAKQGALKQAGLSGNMELLQWLLERGLTPGDDDLEFAVDMQRVDVVKMLLDAGMQLPLERRLNSAFKSIFEIANLEILTLLLAKVPEPKLAEALEEDRPVSLLRKVLAKGDLDKARLLIEKGADVNHPRPNTDPADSELGSLDDPGSPLGQGRVPGMMPNFQGMPGSGMYGMGMMYGMPGMMGMGGRDDGLESLSVISLALRICDPDFLKLLIDKGAETDRREEDGSTPLHHAAANPDSAILKFFLAKQPNQARDDLYAAIQIAASSGRLEQVKMLEQAGANLDDIINASFQGRNLDLIEYLIEKADKPLSENEAWRLALVDLENVLWTEESDEESEDGYVQRILNPKLTDRDFARIRNIATVMIENGLNSSVIKNAGDIANLTREGTAKLFQNCRFRRRGQHGRQ